MRWKREAVWVSAMAAVGAVLAVAGCVHSSGASGAQAQEPDRPAVDPKVVAAEEARLLAALRRGFSVSGKTVTIETTSNFRDSVVLWGERRDLHEVTTETADAWNEKRWVNVRGGESQPIGIRVGDTSPGEGGSEFFGLEEVRQRILVGTQAFTLRVVVEGDVIYAEGQGDLVHAQRVVFEDGKVAAQ